MDYIGIAVVVMGADEPSTAFLVQQALLKEAQVLRELAHVERQRLLKHVF